MKFLKYVVLLILALIVGTVIYTYTQPNTYDVSSTKIIKAPISTVFNTVNDFKNWKKWGPWHEEDPTIKTTYGNKTVGVGASHSWTSKDGPGKMATLAVEPNKSITQNLQFGDYEPTDVLWDFKEVPEGTQATWRMKADKIPFIFKFFGALSGGMDNMLQKMLDRGMVRLDSVISSEKATLPKQKGYSTSEITVSDYPTQHFIGYKHASSLQNQKVLQANFEASIPKAFNHAVKAGISHEKAVPTAIYTYVDEKTYDAKYIIGTIIPKPIAPAKDMTVMNLPKGKVLKVSKFGPYGTGDFEVHQLIAEYMTANNLTQNGPVWECYVNDPTQVKPEEIQTDIYYAVK